MSSFEDFAARIGRRQTCAGMDISVKELQAGPLDGIGKESLHG
jgi:hypothetical protein